MARNFDIVVPYDTVSVAVNLTTADTTYDGSTATVLFTATKLCRIPWIRLQSRGTNATPGLVRLHLVTGSGSPAPGAIAPLGAETRFPSTVASNVAPQWSITKFFDDLYLDAGAQIRAQITVAAAAGISVSCIPQRMDT